MKKWMQLLRGAALRRVSMGVVLLAVALGGFAWGRWGGSPRADAQVPQNAPAPNLVAATPGAKPGDYASRVVAYLYNNTVAVTREELGEYLIARFGAERLDFVVNRKIVEMECAAKGIVVDDSEVRVQLQNDLRAFGNISEKDFVNQILKRYNKTLYEWKEDVIRPKLMIAKLARPTLNITEEELRQAFDAKYGAKVQVRLIVMHKDNTRMFDIWQRASKGRAEFLAEAKGQFLPALAAREGEVPPIHKHFGDPRLEQIAFGLKEGEISPLVDLKDGTHVAMLCEKHLPPEAGKRYEEERMRLFADTTELKLAQRIPEIVQELRQRANPQLLLAAHAPPSATPPAQPINSAAQSAPALNSATPPAQPINSAAPPAPAFNPATPSAPAFNPVAPVDQGIVPVPGPGSS
jgi:hypothetical protein